MKLIEKLAEQEHWQWMSWAQSVMQSEDGLSSERRRRWKKLMVPYADLPEESKEQDRVWARKVLTIIKEHKR